MNRLVPATAFCVAAMNWASISPSGAATTATAATSPASWRVEARWTEPPGNITLAAGDRGFASLHQFYKPAMRVVAFQGDGSLMPFPTPGLSDGTTATAVSLDSVLGLMADRQGRVWLLDNGMRSGVTPKLVGWDIKRDRLARVIHLPPPVTPAKGAFVNDLAVSPDGKTIFIADPASGADAALIVVDVETGMARRVLEGHASVVPEPGAELALDGKAVEIVTPDGPVKPRIGVNPIVIDGKGEWLYFGPMVGTALYRVKAAVLTDAATPPSKLAAAVERYADKPVCDGAAMDAAGNIYLGELAADGYGVIGARDRKYRRLASSPELSWVDSLALSADGRRVWGVANQLHRSPGINGGKDLSKPPFLVFSFPVSK